MPGPCEDQKRVSDPAELELGTIVRCYVGALEEYQDLILRMHLGAYNYP